MLSTKSRLFLVAALVAVTMYTTYRQPNMLHIGMLSVLAILAIDKATWLPFLGQAAMPVSLFQPSIPSGANQSIEVPAPPGARRVVYWASSHANARHPSDAYAGYRNAGVSDVVDGVAVMNIRSPHEYSIRGKRIPKHIHYRFIYAHGLLSDVKTTMI